MYKNWKMYKDNMNEEEYSQVAEWCNNEQKYHIEDLGVYYAIVENSQPTEEELKQARISELKAKLSATDYVVIKINEGVATIEEYAEVLANRKSWREEINELEGSV